MLRPMVTSLPLHTRWRILFRFTHNKTGGSPTQGKIHLYSWKINPKSSFYNVASVCSDYPTIRISIFLSRVLSERAPISAKNGEGFQIDVYRRGCPFYCTGLNTTNCLLVNNLLVHIRPTYHVIYHLANPHSFDYHTSYLFTSCVLHHIMNVITSLTLRGKQICLLINTVDFIDDITKIDNQYFSNCLCSLSLINFSLRQVISWDMWHDEALTKKCLWHKNHGYWSIKG